MHSSNKALIIGTGFGGLYKGIYDNLGWAVTTIDIADPSADFKTVAHAIESGSGHNGSYWDTCHITTPNHTHYELADVCALYADIVFVEKPGVGSATLWSQLLVDHHDTRIMMTKNNQ